MALPFFAGNEHIEDEVGDGDVIWCYLLRNLARSRPILQNQTPRGVSVTQCAHSPMVTDDPGATRVLIFYPCCSWNYFFNADDKQNHSDLSDVISQAPPTPLTLSGAEFCIQLLNTTLIFGKACLLSTNTHTHSDPHQQNCECRVPLGDNRVTRLRS